MGADDKARVISQILKLEWPMFQAVKNVGGQASCQKRQDDFIVVRGTYYLVWDTPSLESLLHDFQTAQNDGRNLVTEKYARMMEYTDPDYYWTNLKPHLPDVPNDAIALTEKITALYLSWEEEFIQKYPGLAKRSRQLSNAMASSETGEKEYLMGELQTYSHETLRKYADHLVRVNSNQINLVFQIKEMTVKYGGYRSLEDAESKIGGNE